MKLLLGDSKNEENRSKNKKKSLLSVDLNTYLVTVIKHIRT